MNSKTIIGGNGTGITGAEGELLCGGEPLNTRKTRNSDLVEAETDERSAGRPGPQHARRWGGLARVLFFLAVLPFCFASPLWAATGQTNSVHHSALANRYLFVVETSRSMLPRGDGALDSIQDLLKSGMLGQLETGDTLGVWIFNKELVRGEFPLQTWSPRDQPGITGRVLNYLRNQRCEEKARLDKVMPVVQQVVQRSRYITVVIISSGEQSIQGTPFDEPINNAYKTWRKQQEKAHMPFVTVLQAEKGTITDYRVGQAPWSPELPPLPKELQLARAAQRKAPVVAIEKAPSPTLPPLIVSGRKPQPTPPAPATPPRAATNLPVATSPVGTNPNPQLAPAVTPPPTTPVPPAAAVNPPPSASVTTAAPEPAPQPASAPAVTEKGNGTQLKLQPQSLAATSTEPHPVEPRVSSHHASESDTTATAKTPALPVKDPEPAPTVSAAKPASSILPRPAEATILPERAGSNNLLIWAGAVCGVALGAALACFWRLRGRSSEASGSLITHSLEQHK